MPSVLSRLRSSFGRRILLLLGACIVGPGAVFGYISLQQVEEKFRQETAQRMRLQSRAVAMSIHDGFSSSETEVEFLAGLLGNGTASALRRSSDWSWLVKNRPLLGATLFRDGSRAEGLFGVPCPPPPPQTDAARRHLASGNGWLYLRQNPGGSPRYFLAHAIRGKDPERFLLACEVNPEYLWGRVRDAVPPVTEVSILPPDGTPVFQTQPLPPAVLGQVERERPKGPAGSFEWGEGAGALLVDHAAVFLKPAFLADDWVVVTSQPRSEAFAVAKRFTRVLSLSVALVVLVAGLFAQVQIRRSVAPLAVLNEGTRRISEGDFDSRVEIASGDEFEDLARSFNAMAGRLGSEFRVQAEMGKAIQRILGETDQEKIVEAVLDNVNAVVPCDSMGLSRIDLKVPGDSMLTCIRADASAVPWKIDRTILSLSGSEIHRMKSAGTTVIAGEGAEFGNFLAGWPGTRPAAFLFCPLVSKGDLLGVLTLGYRIPPDPARETVIRLRQVADQVVIALSRSRLLEELAQNDVGTLRALARTVDTNSPWTAGHSDRVTNLAMEIGRELGMPPQEIDLLHRGGLLHDIGKLGVPPGILDKPGKLTMEEFAVVQKHPSKGAEILDPIPNLRKVIPIVFQHHERYDGKGYPQGLSGEEISLHARILSLADVVDALASDRPYRPGWPMEKVLGYARENAGAQFDPAAVEAFLRIEARRGNGVPLEPVSIGA